MARLVELQIRRPLLPLALVAAISAVAAIFASRLELRTRYDALLPENQPSVRELRRIEQHTSAAQTVLILLEGAPEASLRAFGDALVPKLLALGPETISSAEDGPHESRAFLGARGALFLDLPELEDLDRDIEARYGAEVLKASGLDLLDSSSDDSAAAGSANPGPTNPLTVQELKARFAHKGGDALARYPDGYYQRRDGTALVVVARSPLAGGDLARVGPALDRIHQAVAGVAAERGDLGAVKVSYAGDMPTGFLAYSAIRNDLVSVGATGIGLVLLAVLLYFLRLRAVLVIGVTIAVGLLWTFGLTELAIGHLNIATAFLVSIVAGNGINAGILYQARYLEQRRRGDSPEVALRTMMLSTWQPTIIAAIGGLGAYGSLLATSFRAFRDFGFIAASGMVLCWISTTLVVPPLLLLLNHRSENDAPGWTRRFELSYGRPFAYLVGRAPWVWLVLGTAVALGGIAAALHFATNQPLEYDMRRVDNDPNADPQLHHAWTVCIEILGGSEGAMVVVADSAAQARELEAVLKKRWDAAPAGQKPFVAVHTLWDVVPDDQAAKIPLAKQLGARLTTAHRRGLVGAADWKELSELLPPADLKPFGLADIPAELARPFSERDGTRGTLLLIEAEPSTSNDLRYLLRYADSFRETTLPSGAVVRGSGRAVIFGDMLKQTVRDIPKAIGLSLGLTLLALLVTFRRGKHALVVLFALLVGSGGLAIFLDLAGEKINFLNFAALPITFGIGCDYAINVAQRHVADGGHDILGALRTSGGAVVLCSLTTMLGYLALLGSTNLGIRSLGSVAAMGEVCCLLAAVLILPAVYLTVWPQTPAPPAA